MARYVFKFGGTSVGDAKRIKSVAEKVKQAHSEGHEIIVVVSAMSGETNRLTALAGGLLVKPNPREMDVLLSTGEQVTIALLSMALGALGCPAESFTGGQVEILTDSVHSKARIKDIGVAAIQNCLKSGKVAVVAGFQGVNEQGHITTLGRGGSDTTAVALAAKLKASECYIYTDVDGVYTTDPRVEPTARKMDSITFEEMLEMASLGSKVLQIRAVEFAGKYNVPLRVLSTFSEGNGTLITYEDDGMERALISGIAFNRDEAKLTINGVPDLPGVASKIVGPIAANNIEIDMIIQNIADDETTDFTFTVHRNDYHKAVALLEEIKTSLSAKKVSGDDTIVKVSLVGVGMRSHSGIASKMFDVLASEGINIKMISTSEIKISVVIDEKHLEAAVRALHKSFELAGRPVL
ncbi:MAG TPA: aspartate kinase [Methylococcaceae bacterium]|jgi:aspartate kinase|nr:aspartate kinase [Methylococcaceae bacterium]